MKTVTYRDRRVAYQSEGKGPAVVFIHGFCENRFIWEDFTRDLLEEDYRVVTIDLPGFGASEVGAATGVDYYAEAVKAVCEAANVSRPVLIGHSMGGYTALAFAEKYPNDLCGIGLFHSHPYADSDEKRQDRHKQIGFINKHGHEIYVKQVIPKFFAEGFTSTSTFDVDKLIHRASRGPARGLTDALQAMADRPDRAAVLANTAHPVLFIVGEEDQTAPAAYFQDMLPLATRSHIHIMEKVGHMGMLEARSKSQLIVRRFVQFCFAT